MIDLDGSGGGGQLVRTALSLSAITGTAFRMTEVRGGRETPGLRPQHLAAVRTMAAICDAEVSGDEAGSTEFAFRPGGIEAGEFEADIGTAGSVALLFDAVLPLALRADGPIAATARGGTDVKWSPTMAYYRRVKLPLFRGWGLHAAIDRDRVGFYPVGGGEATLRVAPSSPPPLDLDGRGDFGGARIYSTASADLADAEVAERQVAAAREALRDAGLEPVERAVTYAETDCPGSAVAVRLDYRGSMAGFDALGERGTPAEEVGEAAAAAAVDFHAGGAAVDRHMADQVLVPLALVGGRVRVPALTDHVETCRELLAAFDRPVAVEPGPTLVG